MNKKLTTLILVFCISAVALKSALSAGMTGKSLLPEGFVLRGVEGKLARQDSNDGWFFEFDSDFDELSRVAANDSKRQIGAGAKLELLPSSALERMLADANNRSIRNYRLWSMVTKYKDRNFILPIYFFPLGKVEPPQPLPSPQTQERSKLPVDPNDELAIPKEILDKLKTRRTILRQQPERQKTSKQNTVLANRIGFISSCVMRDAYRAEKNTQYDIRNTRYVFILDALGRNIQQTTLRLLPCQALELAEQQASAEPDPIRFKIAGIITEYRGEKFLLLQRATRVYNHGNFDR